MEIRHWGRDLLIKETYFLRVFVSMHSLFPTGYEPRMWCCARLHRKSIWNSAEWYKGVVQDSNHWAFEVFNFKAEWGTAISFNVPGTSWVLWRNVGRTQKLMVWRSWLQCQDYLSDVSGSDLVELQDCKGVVDSNTILSGKISFHFVAWIWHERR